MLRVVRPLTAALSLAVVLGTAAAQSPEPGTLPVKAAPDTGETVKIEVVAPQPAADAAIPEKSPSTPPPPVAPVPAATATTASPIAAPVVILEQPTATAAPTAPEVAPEKPVAVEKPTDPPVAATQIPAPTPTMAPAPPPTVTPAPAPPKPDFALDMGAAIGRIARSAAGDRDRAALTAFYAARQGEPLWVTAKGPTAPAAALAAEIRRAGDYGLDAAQFDLPSLRTAAKGDTSPEHQANIEAEISAAFLKYARHARGGRLDPAALTKFLDRRPTPYDSRSLLDRVATARDPAAYLRDLHPQHPQFERLRQKYLAARSGAPIATATAEPPRAKRGAPGPVVESKASPAACSPTSSSGAGCPTISARSTSGSTCRNTRSAWSRTARSFTPSASSSARPTRRRRSSPTRWSR